MTRNTKKAGQRKMSENNRDMAAGNNKRVCHIGDSASLTKQFTKEDIDGFAAMTLDDNGMHVDPEMCRRGLFRRPVVHGVLVGSLISSVMGTKLPGSGTVLQEQEIKYLNPVYPGDTITAEVTLTAVEEAERYYTATLEGTCRNQDDVLCVEAVCKQLMLKRFFTVE